MTKCVKVKTTTSHAADGINVVVYQAGKTYEEMPDDVAAVALADGWGEPGARRVAPPSGPVAATSNSGNSEQTKPKTEKPKGGKNAGDKAPPKKAGGKGKNAKVSDDSQQSDSAARTSTIAPPSGPIAETVAGVDGGSDSGGAEPQSA